jgi:hypothetical protein
MGKPDPDARPEHAEPPSDELILAAVERAGRHAVRATPAVAVWAILDQLALPRRSGVARHVRARLGALGEAGLLESARSHGVPTWELSGRGRRRLAGARRAGSLPQLPESPQHRTWRQARTLADQELERFRGELRGRLAQAALLIEADPPPDSDEFLQLAEDLQRACRRVGSASHCLNEWQEPSDDRADIDLHLDPADDGLDPDERARRRARRAGRRNISLWDDRPRV